MVMENKTKFFSSSSSPKPDHDPKSIVVAVEEKKPMNNPKQGSPQEIVSERTITERPSVGLGVAQTEREMVIKYLPKDNLVYSCNFCELRFPTFNALCDHQNTHRQDQALERQQKKNESSYGPRKSVWPKPYNAYQNNLNSFLRGYSQVASSNVKYLGTSLNPSTLIGGGGSSIIACPPFNGGVTREITDINMTVGHPVTPYRSSIRNTSYGSSSKDLLPSYNYNMIDNHVGPSPGPFKFIGGGSSNNNNAYPWFNRGVTSGITETVVPRATPCRYFIDNTIYKSASRDTLPSYNYSLHAISNDGHVELSLGPFKSIGGGDNNYSPHTISNNDDLELSLGPVKSIEDNNSNNIVYPSFDVGVTRGTTDLNMPLLPRVTRYHYVNGNPLDSITRNVPPPPSTNLSNDLSSLQENVSGSNYSENLISKGKTKIMVDDDDDDDDDDADDDDADADDEDDAKSWGHDLSLSL